MNYRTKTQKLKFDLDDSFCRMNYRTKTQKLKFDPDDTKL